MVTQQDIHNGEIKVTETVRQTEDHNEHIVEEQPSCSSDALPDAVTILVSNDTKNDTNVFVKTTFVSTSVGRCYK